MSKRVSQRERSRRREQSRKDHYEHASPRERSRLDWQASLRHAAFRRALGLSEPYPWLKQLHVGTYYNVD